MRMACSDFALPFGPAVASGKRKALQGPVPASNGKRFIPDAPVDGGLLRGSANGVEEIKGRHEDGGCSQHLVRTAYLLAREVDT